MLPCARPPARPPLHEWHNCRFLHHGPKRALGLALTSEGAHQAHLTPEGQQRLLRYSLIGKICAASKVEPIWPTSRLDQHRHHQVPAD